MGRFFSSGSPRVPLPAEQRARLDAWVAYLDVDLELAQATLRLPPSQLPDPPGWSPQVVDEVVETPPPAEVSPPPPEAPPPSTRPLRGAYARRAAP